MDPLLTAIPNLGCQSFYQKLISDFITAKELERKKYQDTVIKMKFTMSQKIVKIGDEDGISAFKNVVASGANSHSLLDYPLTNLPGPNFLLRQDPITIVFTPTVSQKESSPVLENLNIQRISRTECVVETQNGPMLVSNEVMQSELQKFNLNPDLPEIENPCPSCKLQEEKLKILEDSLKNEVEEKSKCQMECREMHSMTQKRELFWMGQAQNLVEKIEYYKNLSISVPLESTKDGLCENGEQDPLSPPSPDFVYPPMAPRRRPKEAVELPEPLNRNSDEYKILLHQALTNTKTCPIYKDKKIVLRSSLFSAIGSSPMPQLVNNPPRAHLLYRKWRETNASWITMSDIIKEWNTMRNDKTQEYLDWKGRENALFDEHVDQLKKGYIKCYKRRVIEKRKSYAREAVQVPIGSSHGVVFVDL